MFTTIVILVTIATLTAIIGGILDYVLHVEDTEQFKDYILEVETDEGTFLVTVYSETACRLKTWHSIKNAIRANGGTDEDIIRAKETLKEDGVIHK